MALCGLRRAWRNAAVVPRSSRRLLSPGLPPIFHSPVQLNAACTSPPNNRVFVRQLASDSIRTLSKHCELANAQVDKASHDIVIGEANCSGCGSPFQTEDPNLSGFLPKEKLLPPSPDSRPQDEETEEEVDKQKTTESRAVICQRCFSLLHYNTALDITLKADDYLTHLAQLREKRALILLMIDVVDFPGSLFPSLNTLISPDSAVVVVANKADLLPKTTRSNLWRRFEGTIRDECLKTSLSGCEIAGVHFISAKLGRGVEELSQAISKHWGNRGDVFLLGCTNVGKSTLFNRLLVHLCGATPGELSSERNSLAPAATISQWPGTTLGLLSFPVMSTGKRTRLAGQARRKLNHTSVDDDVLETMAFKDEAKEEEEGDLTREQAGAMAAVENPEEDAVLREVGLRGHSKRRREPGAAPLPSTTPPQDRFRLYDTPGAINDAQLINLLTTKELKLALPKKAIRPETFILKPGQCMFIGGLARLDYHEGSVSAYFTVYANSYLPIHTTKISRADDVYSLNFGTPLLKIPTGDEERLSAFPPLKFEPIPITGLGWKESCADVVLSSAGWVSVTIGAGHSITLLAHTPHGRGIHCRQPALFPEHVGERGKRSEKGNRTSFAPKKKKK